MSDECANPAHKGHHKSGVLAVHVGAVKGEKHPDRQGCPKQAHYRIVNRWRGPSTPVGSGQAWPRRLLFPVWPRVGANDAAPVQTIRGPNVGTGT
jgi:hypothetical protein